ncbi:hypothetical protein CISG_01069 [Coccidioides immitis RMSCC 3703]|uniref:Uncharacterized protein n=1 Tax=Coccidioides immitis RMSCC 3703 TaxID=454286 RepID=A0A0J8QW87_COCIT|nr:hypothetical protein CISG_01069 [Coccidioides immitis RMSCC 3703]
MTRDKISLSFPENLCTLDSIGSPVESSSGGNDDLVIKVNTQENEDYTVYTGLEKRVPDTSTPGAHGMIQLGPFPAIFISYLH